MFRMLKYVLLAGALLTLSPHAMAETPADLARHGPLPKCPLKAATKLSTISLWRTETPDIAKIWPATLFVSLSTRLLKREIFRGRHTPRDGR